MEEGVFVKSLIVPSGVGVLSWLGGSILNYATKSKTGMHFSVKSFFKNVLVITAAGSIIEYKRLSDSRKPPPK